MSGVVKHIIGSLGEIGGEIVKETAKIPADLAGQALESLGTSSGKAQGAQHPKKSDSQGEKTLGNVTNAQDRQAKRAMARNALIEYVGYGRPKKEPSVWEKKQQEEAERKLSETEQKKKTEKQTLPHVSTVRKRGNLYGIDTKSSPEKRKNVLAE